MSTLSGDLGTLTGGSLTFPNGQPVRAVLSPAATMFFDGTSMKVGGAEIAVATDGTFSQANVTNGTYQLIVTYYDPDRRAPAVENIPVVVSGDTVVTV